jgi:hypothetical protein
MVDRILAACLVATLLACGACGGAISSTDAGASSDAGMAAAAVDAVADTTTGNCEGKCAAGLRCVAAISDRASRYCATIVGEGAPCDFDGNVCDDTAGLHCDYEKQICLPPETAGFACIESDFAPDCASGYFCRVETTSFDSNIGHCAIFQPVGGPCADTSECLAPLHCSNDVPPRSATGMCQRATTKGEPCDSDLDCESGLCQPVDAYSGLCQ